MPPSPRQHRDRDRSRRAAAAIRATGGSAMDQALAEIGAAFDESAVVNGFKLRVERYLRLGPHHPACRARFDARAALIGGRDLDAAVATVERWWRDERKAFQVASALGCATRLPLDVLAELRLVLRLMRFKRMTADYADAIAALRGRPSAMAAE
jgi:hypothetical protein